MKRLKLLFAALNLILLSACQVELYANLDEKTANEMLAILNHEGIIADKVKAKKSTAIMVDESDFADAITLLRAYGLPKENYSNLGKVFEKQGLISSPAEEWARFVYARGQELAQSISKIDGIISANVHLSIEKKRHLLDKPAPPRASVMIEHLDHLNTHILRPQIKQMIVLSVDGLQYDNVSLLFSPIRQNQKNNNKVQNQHDETQGLDEKAEPLNLWWLFIIALLCATILLLIFLFFDKIKQWSLKYVS